MIEFVRGSLATIAGSLILLTVFVLIVRRMIKHGGCDCGGCGGCSACGACRRSVGAKKEAPANKTHRSRIFRADLAGKSE